MSYGVGRRHGSDPTLLWLWRRLVATAPIGRLAWERPYAAGVTLEKNKQEEKQCFFQGFRMVCLSLLLLSSVLKAHVPLTFVGGGSVAVASVKCS